MKYFSQQKIKSDYFMIKILHFANFHLLIHVNIHDIMLHLVYLSMLSDAGSVEIPELLLDFAGKQRLADAKTKKEKLLMQSS